MKETKSPDPSGHFDVARAKDCYNDVLALIEATEIPQEEQDTIKKNLGSAMSLMGENPNDIALAFVKSALSTGYASVEGILKKTIETETFKKQATIDHLTGIPNRTAFDDLLQSAIDRRATPVKTSPTTPDDSNERQPSQQNSQHYSALIFLDLDRFKGLNDTYGHQAGDSGLQYFSNLITHITREGDQNIYTSDTHKRARLGGDEFSIILNIEAQNPDEARSNLNKALLRIRKELAVHGIDIDNENKHITLPIVSSCGIHIIEEGDTIKSVMEGADSALYKHKEGVDENQRTKQERYEHCVKELTHQGKPNVQSVADKRAEEKELEHIMNVGTALCDLNDVKIILPKGSDKDLIQALKEEGIEVFSDNVTTNDHHGFAPS